MCPNMWKIEIFTKKHAHCLNEHKRMKVREEDYNLLTILNICVQHCC